MRLNQRQIWIKCQDKTGLVEWRSHLQKCSCELYGRNRRNKKKQDAKEPSHQHLPDARSDQKKGFFVCWFSRSSKSLYSPNIPSVSSACKGKPWSFVRGNDALFKAVSGRVPSHLLGSSTLRSSACS